MNRHPGNIRLATLMLSGIAGVNGVMWSGGIDGMNPVKPDQASVRQGAALYNKHCASCHGAKGKGDGKAACDLDPRPSDLTDGTIAGMSDAKLFRKITNGRKPMPSFSKLMSDQERWHVVNFVRTLASPAHSGEKR